MQGKVANATASGRKDLAGIGRALLIPRMNPTSSKNGKYHHLNMIENIFCYTRDMSNNPSRHDISHERIVDVAARALRRTGYAGVGVADVMCQAGLTHGGFYAHFPSREALLTEALVHAARDGSAMMGRRMNWRQARGQTAFRALVESYLSDSHLHDVESGCVVAALGSEMSRQTPAFREPSAACVRGLITKVQQAMSDQSMPTKAMVIASTLVGTMQLARTLGANTQGKALLAAARSELLAQYDTR